MASGKTLELIKQSRETFWRRFEPRPKVNRDRSLSGKKRVKARKAKNKTS